MHDINTNFCKETSVTVVSAASIICFDDSVSMPFQYHQNRLLFGDLFFKNKQSIILEKMSGWSFCCNFTYSLERTQQGIYEKQIEQNDEDR